MRRLQLRVGLVLGVAAAVVGEADALVARIMRPLPGHG